MASITLDERDLDTLADLIVERLMGRIELVDELPTGWLSTREAADYLGLSLNAMHKHCAARTIPFEQDKPGARCWFKAADLDAWRRDDAG